MGASGRLAAAKEEAKAAEGAAEGQYRFASDLSREESGALYMSAVAATHQEEAWRRERRRLAKELRARDWQPPTRLKQPRREAGGQAQGSSKQEEPPPPPAKQQSSRAPPAQTGGAGRSRRTAAAKEESSYSKSYTGSEEEEAQDRKPARPAPRVARKAAAPHPGLKTAPKASANPHRPKPYQ